MTKPNAKTRDKVAFGLVGLLIAAIITAADLGIAKPVFDFVRSFPMSDKVVHFLLMGTLAYFANRVLKRRALARARRLPLLGTTLVALAVALEEVSQIWIPGRTFSASDVIADGLGIAVAELLFRRQSRNTQELAGKTAEA